MRRKIDEERPLSCAEVGHVRHPDGGGGHFPREPILSADGRQLGVMCSNCRVPTEVDFKCPGCGAMRRGGRTRMGAWIWVDPDPAGHLALIGETVRAYEKDDAKNRNVVPAVRHPCSK